MTERERLIELLMQGDIAAAKQGVFNCCMCRREAETIADYLLENGVIVPLVKMGDIVYIDNAPHNVVHIAIEEDGISYCAKYDCDEYECCKECPFAKEISFGEVIMCEGNEYHEFTASDIGKTVFLTREEAEKALKESEDNV